MFPAQNSTHCFGEASHLVPGWSQVHLLLRPSYFSTLQRSQEHRQQTEMRILVASVELRVCLGQEVSLVQSKYSVLDWLVHYLARALFQYKVFWHLSNETPSCIYNERCRLTLHITFGVVLIGSTAASSVDAPSFNASTTEVKTTVDRPSFGYHDM